MITENLIFIHKMIEEKRSLYSILSFLSESIDTMRTNVSEHPVTSDAIYKQLSNSVVELIKLDGLMDNENYR